MPYICLIGNDGAGKSTVAQHIANLYSNEGIDVHVVSFANPLKEMLSSVGIPTFTKPYPAPIRTAMRAMGDVMRHVHGDNYWAKQLIDYIKSKNKPGVDQVFIVDDMRYWSEFNAWLDAYSDQAYIISLGQAIPVKATDPASILEVNDLLSFLRKQNHGLYSRLLFLDKQPSIDYASIDRFISKINNK